MTTPGITKLVKYRKHLMFCTIVWQEWRKKREITKEQENTLKRIGETDFLAFIQKNS